MKKYILTFTNCFLTELHAPLPLQCFRYFVRPYPIFTVPRLLNEYPGRLGEEGGLRGGAYATLFHKRSFGATNVGGRRL